MNDSSGSGVLVYTVCIVYVHNVHICTVVSYDACCDTCILYI